MSGLTSTDWTILGGYLLAVFLLGTWFARRQRSNEDYFVGGRSMNWAAVGVSLFATAFSSLSFLALPREAAYDDYHFLLALLFIPFVITPVLWWLLVPLLLHLRVTSLYEYLEIRFSRPLRKLGSLLFAGYAIGWMGSMLYATGMILQVVMGLTDFQLTWTLVGLGAFAVCYTMAGGVQAVIWTDVLQACTLGGGVLVVLLLAVGHVEGGWQTVWQLGAEHDKFAMFHFTTDLAERRSVLAACAFGLLMYLPGYVTSQVTVQRYICVRSLSDARKALVINAVVATLVAVLFFVMGSTLFAFYHQAGAAGFPELAREDQIVPYFVATELPAVGLMGLLLAGLFAAVMSTIDSGINSLTAVVVYDWLSGRDLSVRASRVLSGLFGVAVIGAALLAPYLGEHVIGIITRIAGTFLGLLLGVFLLGMLVPRANSGGTLIGLAIGALSLVDVWLLTDVPHWWYGAVTSVPTFVIGAAASLLFPPPRPDQHRGFALWLQKNPTPGNSASGG